MGLLHAERYLCIVFFFFKQKTAYELLRSLVGSEMCIRDSAWAVLKGAQLAFVLVGAHGQVVCQSSSDLSKCDICLLYTSDAADDLPCVDLGGRRNIKKKNNTTHNPERTATIVGRLDLVTRNTLDTMYISPR